VNHYFANAPSMPQPHFFNKDGRGLPDISAVGVGYQVISGKTQQTYSGTGAATVTAAAMISLLNEIRVVHNKPVLGFL
jgi:tripeptidyl-peptidase-1